MFLPRDCEAQSNLSYAFLNFRSEAHALAFKARWHRARLSHFRAQQPLNIAFADLQGFDANVSRLVQKRNFCKVARCQCEPVVVRDLQPMPLSFALAIGDPSMSPASHAGYAEML